MTSGTRRSISVSLEDLQLLSRFTDLMADEELGAVK